MEKQKFDIYEEGFCSNEISAKAHYIGSEYAYSFIEACEKFIRHVGTGEIRVDEDGNKYACDWGCKWYPTLDEAAKAFG